jgi:hypothetical protein
MGDMSKPSRRGRSHAVQDQVWFTDFRRQILRVNLWWQASITFRADVCEFDESTACKHCDKYVVISLVVLRLVVIVRSVALTLCRLSGVAREELDIIRRPNAARNIPPGILQYDPIVNPDRHCRQLSGLTSRFSDFVPLIGLSLLFFLRFRRRKILLSNAGLNPDVCQTWPTGL